MHQLLHASLQVRRVGVHRELRFVLHILPYHNILTSRRGRAADGEQKPAIEADLEEAQDFASGGVLRQIAQAREADGEEGSVGVRVVRALNAGSDAEMNFKLF